MAGYPNMAKSIWGWYQNWTVIAAESGEYRLEWWDNGNQGSSSSVHESKTYKQILLNDVIYWEEDIADYNDMDGGLPSETGSQSFNEEAGQSITVGIALKGPFAYASYGAKFRLYDPENNVVDLSEGEYRSGLDTAVDENTQAMYDCAVSFYTSHDYEETCLVAE